MGLLIPKTSLSSNIYFPRWERALPATLFDAELYLPSLKIEDACDATLGEVTFFAI